MSTDPTVLTVVVADDSVLLREGLVRLLAENGIDVVDAVGDAGRLLDSVARHRPDLCVVDVRMPPSFTDEGLRAALAIRATWPETAVLVLSQYVEEHYATELLGTRGGGVGYLLKDRVADVADFLVSLRRVAGGGTALDAEVVSQLLARTRHTDPLANLTPREGDVLAAMAQGRSKGGIAADLAIGEGPVEKHISNIFAKLDLHPDAGEHRRVLAVLRFLGEGRG